MNATLAAFIIASVGWVVTVLVLTYRMGKRHEQTTNRLRNHTSDIQELHRIISINQEQQNERYIDFYREFIEFRIKLAAKLGINGRN